MYVQVRSLWDRMPKTMPILVHAECYSEAYSEVAALKEACKSKKRKKSTESNVSDRPNSNLTKAQTNSGVYTFVRRDVLEKNMGNLMRLPVSERVLDMDATYKIDRAGGALNTLGTHTVRWRENNDDTNSILAQLTVCGSLKSPP